MAIVSYTYKHTFAMKRKTRVSSLSPPEVNIDRFTNILDASRAEFFVYC